MAFGEGLEGVEVGRENLSFSLLKHKPKVGVNAILRMILITFPSIHQDILFLTEFAEDSGKRPIASSRKAAPQFARCFTKIAREHKQAQALKRWQKQSK